MNQDEGRLERPSVQRRQAERRRLWERRAPGARRTSDNRRSAERRSSALQSPAERRAGADRRQADRRAASDRRAVSARRRGRRRRETPSPYTSEQITELRTRFAAPGPVSCPACGSGFTLGPGRRRGTEIARRVMCLGCSRAAVVENTRAARVLVIDNVRNRRDALQAILSSAGHEVIETADAAVALLAYSAAPADIVFIDVLAPGRMEAQEFLRRLRRAYPDARVVAMAARPSYTGAFDPAAIMQGHGAVRTIRLPLSRDDVLRTVEEVRS